MAVIAGQRLTSTQTTETRSVRDVKAEINQLEPNQYPLVAILNQASNRLSQTGNVKFEWFEDTLLPRFDVLGADLTAGASSMTVTNYAYFRAGDLVRINKSEIVLVSATPSSTTVSITRAVGGSAAAASSGQQLHIIGNVSDEGDTVGSVLSTQKVLQYNYCGLVKTPYKITGTAQASKVYGKDEKAYEIAKCIIEHAKSWEMLNILGVRYSSGNKRVPNGILAVIASNIKDAGGELTETELEDFLRKPFRYGNKKKILFASGLLCTVINGFGREKLQTRSDEKTYGVTMTNYINAGRQVEIVEHPLLENDSLSDLTGLAGYGIVVDIGDLSFRHLPGRYMKKDEVNPNSDSTLYDGVVGQILTEGGLQLEQEKKHAVLTGVTE